VWENGNNGQFEIISVSFFPLIRSMYFLCVCVFLMSKVGSLLRQKKIISRGLENPMQQAWPEGCTLPSKLGANSFSHSSVVVVVMVRQEY